MINKTLKVKPLFFAVCCILTNTINAQEIKPINPQTEGSGEEFLELNTLQVLGTAQEELKQSAGVSVITAEDIKKQPPVNDLSDIIRKMPGVNLTGNSSSGQRGNNRQIDLRGMGPENTLILIDGKPVSSRNSVRYGWRGERDSRGDSNWVPAEEVERIEVIRGPAAARYGSGAAGGVVNIVTKKIATEHHGKLTLYGNLPEHSEEGATRRVSFGLSGPLAENLSYRIYGNFNKTDRDSSHINEGKQPAGSSAAAGREGVRNKDINGLFAWQVNPEHLLEFEAGVSRQGNIYAGDTQNNNQIVGDPVISPWIGRETNRMFRRNYGITHTGDFDWGTSKSFVQYETTTNNRLIDGLAGATEGAPTGTEFGSVRLKSYTAHSEVNIPFEALFHQVATLGMEWSEQRINDPVSTRQTLGFGSIPGYNPDKRDSKASMRTRSVFLEDNIELRPGTMLIPGLRYDNNSTFGDNFSPSLNFSQTLGEMFTLKTGIARAFKAPNLYQSNPNYLLASRGNGCPVGSSVSCYLLGNDKLKPEISINKELGLEFNHNDWVAGITYFRNDYKNKIDSGLVPIAQTSAGNDVLRWENSKKAVVEGLEGNVTVPFSEQLKWTTNITYMIQSKNKDTGNPLSVIPQYTVNSMLDWQATDVLSTQLNLTTYGRQKPMKNALSRTDAANGLSGKAQGVYSLVGLNANYKFTDNVQVGFGVSNLFDKRLFRKGNASDAGGSTYNEPGRTFYTSISTSF